MVPERQYVDGTINGATLKRCTVFFQGAEVFTIYQSRQSLCCQLLGQWGERLLLCCYQLSSLHLQPEAANDPLIRFNELWPSHPRHLIPVPGFSQSLPRVSPALGCSLSGRVTAHYEAGSFASLSMPTDGLSAAAVVL